MEYAKGVGEDTKGRVEERGVGGGGRGRIEGLQVVLQKALGISGKDTEKACEDTRFKGRI